MIKSQHLHTFDIELDRAVCFYIAEILSEVRSLAEDFFPMVTTVSSEGQKRREGSVAMFLILYESVCVPNGKRPGDGRRLRGTGSSSSAAQIH